MGHHALSISPILVIDDNLNKWVYIINIGNKYANYPRINCVQEVVFDMVKYHEDTNPYQN